MYGTYLTLSVLSSSLDPFSPLPPLCSPPLLIPFSRPHLLSLSRPLPLPPSLPGAHDCKIYLYDIKTEARGPSGITAVTTKLRATFAKHNRCAPHSEYPHVCLTSLPILLSTLTSLFPTRPHYNFSFYLILYPIPLSLYIINLLPHVSVINHLDISQDGRFMQSNCSAYELLFSDTHTGEILYHIRSC
jgi:hypothetical protein